MISLTFCSILFTLVVRWYSRRSLCPRGPQFFLGFGAAHLDHERLPLDVDPLLDGLDLVRRKMAEPPLPLEVILDGTPLLGNLHGHAVLAVLHLVERED